MSGGSFNYLCSKNGDEIRSSGLEDLENMIHALPEGSQARADTQAIYDRLRAPSDLDDKIQALYSVWHAVEWAYSCDWSKDQMFKAITAYEVRGSR